MSQSLTLARPYARAVFALAEQHATLTDWSQVLAFSATAAAQPSLRSLLTHPQLSNEAAVALLACPAVPETISALYTQFLNVLAQARRLAQLPDIFALFEQLRRDASRVVKATIASACVLTETQRTTLLTALEQRLNRRVEADFLVDESLLGGALIDAGEVVIDGSVKGKLQRLQAALIH